jgi:hypothetical protein
MDGNKFAEWFYQFEHKGKNVYVDHKRDGMKNSELNAGAGTRLTLDDDNDDMATLIIFS